MLWNKPKGKRRGSTLGWGAQLIVRAAELTWGTLDDFQETVRPGGRKVWLPLQIADIV